MSTDCTAYLKSELTGSSISIGGEGEGYSCRNSLQYGKQYFVQISCNSPQSGIVTVFDETTMPVIPFGLSNYSAILQYSASMVMKLHLEDDQMISGTIYTNDPYILGVGISFQSCNSNGDVADFEFFSDHISIDGTTCQGGDYYFSIYSFGSTEVQVSLNVSTGVTPCPNCCSRVGTCNPNGTCDCILNFGGSDCSIPQCGTYTLNSCPMKSGIPVVVSPLVSQILGSTPCVQSVNDLDDLLFQEINQLFVSMPQNCAETYLQLVCDAYLSTCEDANTILVPCSDDCFKVSRACSSCTPALSSIESQCQVWNTSIFQAVGDIDIQCNSAAVPRATTGASMTTLNPGITSASITSGRIQSGQVTTGQAASSGSTTQGGGSCLSQCLAFCGENEVKVCSCNGNEVESVECDTETVSEASIILGSVVLASVAVLF